MCFGRKITSELKLNCLIIEKRNHIGGNCYDEYNSKGLLYHKYGPILDLKIEKQ